MNHLNYNSGIEHLFQYFKAEQFMQFASLNQHLLSMVQKYFETKPMLTFKTDGITTEIQHPKQTFFIIRINRAALNNIYGPISTLANGDFVFRPVSIKYKYGISMYGWIISGKQMIKTGQHFKPYPWWFKIYTPSVSEKIITFDISKHSPIIRVIGRTSQIKLV